MNDQVNFSCGISTTDATAPLGMEIWLDDQEIFNDNHISTKIDFEHKISDVESEHELRFVLKGKLPEHTTLDESGRIVSDARLLITDVKFDGIDLGHLFVKSTTYTHDFNGTKPTVVELFYGELGCNGTVTLKFTTPIYLWFLENM